MDTSEAPPDFTDLLRLLNANEVEYLVIGAYAVGFHGYPRGTVDLDVWVAMKPDNARHVVAALRAFGFDIPQLTEGLFLSEDQIVRMGVPPFRIELMTSITGVEFDACYARRIEGTLGDVPTPFIGLEDLRTNKAASARPKDLADLDQLPPVE